MEKTIECLITTFGLSKPEIIDLLKSLNIFCDVIIRNQTSVNSNESFVFEGFNVLIVNSTDRGVGRNRNEIIKLSSADYVVFCDDDMRFVKEANNIIYSELNNKKYPSAMAFNVVSLNDERPIKQYNGKCKNCFFKDVRRDGVWRFCFKRQDAISILFNEIIGSGTSFLCGEDTIYIKEYLSSYGKNVYISNKIIASVSHKASNWYEKRNTDEYLYAKGYVYKKIYPFLYKLVIIRFLMKEGKLTKSNYRKCIRGAKIIESIITTDGETKVKL